ncbi:MAG: dehydrogenase [Clostridiales bacterium]|jgi:D-glycero-alpha-D-manno-heptose-7-phosphate kinase|nr:dehydrogenase [Clostridiales bacterium]
MIIRSKAPLRIGLAGGGTDLSPYCDQFGGVVLNATINMFAYCMIETNASNFITINAKEIQDKQQINLNEKIAIDSVKKTLKLHVGVYNKVLKMFGNLPCGFKLTTYNEADMGSGLGGSSTMIVAMLKCYVEWLKLPLGEYDIAHLAWEIERKDLTLMGGKQDQYAATFGGFNLIQFEADDRVIVNPLRIKRWIKNELESSLVLYYTGKSRESAKIIEQQIKSVNEDENRLEGMHQLKKAAYKMKDAVLTGDFYQFGEALQEGWYAKKRTSDVISNPHLEEIYDAVMVSGGIAGKLSGAGGGGFFMFYVKPEMRPDVVNTLMAFKGKIVIPQFTDEGSLGWIIR